MSGIVVFGAGSGYKEVGDPLTMYAIAPLGCSVRWLPFLALGAAAVSIACGAPPQDEASLEQELADRDLVGSDGTGRDSEGYDPVETVEVTVYDYPMQDEASDGSTSGEASDDEVQTSGIRQVIIRHYPPGYDLEASDATDE